MQSFSEQANGISIPGRGRITKTRFILLAETVKTVGKIYETMVFKTGHQAVRTGILERQDTNEVSLLPGEDFQAWL